MFYVQVINLANLGKQAGLSRCSVSRMFSAIFTSNYLSTPPPEKYFTPCKLSRLSVPTICLYLPPRAPEKIKCLASWTRSRRLQFLAWLRAAGKVIYKPCIPDLFCSLFCHCTTAEDTSSYDIKKFYFLPLPFFKNRVYYFGVRLLTTCPHGARMGKHLGPW